MGHRAHRAQGNTAGSGQDAEVKGRRSVKTDDRDQKSEVRIGDWGLWNEKIREVVEVVEIVKGVEVVGVVNS